MSFFILKDKAKQIGNTSSLFQNERGFFIAYKKQLKNAPSDKVKHQKG
jgi:hypothetical protein